MLSVEYRLLLWFCSWWIAASLRFDGSFFRVFIRSKTLADLAVK